MKFMRVRSFLLIFLLMNRLPTMCSPLKSLLLDRIQYSIFPDQMDGTGNEGFPSYFEKSEFMQRTMDSIRVYAKEYLNCDSVGLTGNFGVYSFVNQYPGRLKPTRPRKTSAGNYKMTLTTYLEYSSDKHVSTFEIVSRIYITNDRGRPFLEQENTIPFSILKNRAITGDTIISESDFSRLYLENIKAVFRGSPNISPYHEYRQPASHLYDRFLQHATAYSSYVENNEAYYLMGADSVEQPVLNYIVLQNNLWNENLYSLMTWGDTVQLVDTQTGALYKLGLRGKKSFDYVYNSYSTLVKAILTMGDRKLGYFEYNDLAMLKGTFEGEKVEIRWMESYHIAEIIVGGKIVALLHDTADQRTLYVNNERSMTVYDVMKLVAVYDFVYMEQQKLVNDAPQKEEFPIENIPPN